jgi:endonuclease/exonuclease/phosphatase family metal-dependent hydrolase
MMRHGLSRLRGAGLTPGLAIAAWLSGCSFHDHPGSSDWIPFGAVSGPLRPESENLVPPPATVGSSLRVATYNLHMVPDLPGLLAALQGNAQLAKADVFLFEEIESHPSQGKSQAALLAASLGMNHAYAPAWTYPDGGTHGVACLSRFPITDAQVLYLPYYELGGASELRLAIRVTLAIGGKTLEVIGLHLDTKLNVNDRLKQLYPAMRLAGTNTILGGDFNSNPWIWVDRTFPLLSEDAVAPVDAAKAIDEVMVYNGFDAPTGTSGTTTNLPAFNARLDSIYTRGYAPTEFGVERSVTVSDHFPVWVDVAWVP